MKILLIIFLLFISFVLVWWISALPVNRKKQMAPNQQIISLSGQLLLNIKTEAPTDSLELVLSKLSLPDLITGLSDDDARKTFWINIYNSFFQILAARKMNRKLQIFSEKLITIAGTKFSLDDIEHGILRKYRWKYGLGYLPQLFPPKIIKQLAVSKIDYRIHFTLNCGAKSCPLIAFYSYDKINEQLEKAMKSFLHSEVEINEAKKEVNVNKIMYWFKGDFGGTNGIKNILSNYFTKDFSAYSIKFKEYDWTEQLKNFKSQE